MMQATMMARRHAPDAARAARAAHAAAHLAADGDQPASAAARVLRSHRLAGTDEGHATALLALMAPPPGALVADLGCGCADVARLMRSTRPDLSFLLVSRNRSQFQHLPMGEAYRQVRSGLQRLALPSCIVDGCMALGTLCQVGMPLALLEAARITRPGGFLLVHDFERLDGDNAGLERLFSARVWPRADFADMAARAGWVPGQPVAVPAGAVAWAPDDAAHAGALAGLVPVVWRLVRRYRVPV